MPLATGAGATSKRLKVCKAEEISVLCTRGREGKDRSEKRKACPDFPSKLNHYIVLLHVSWGGRSKGTRERPGVFTDGILFS